MPGASRLLALEAQLSPTRGVTVVQQIQTPAELVALADIVGGPGKGGDAPQEAPVGFVTVRHRAESLPSIAAQLVQTAVVAGAGVGVRGDHLVVGQSLLGQYRPGHRGGGVGGGHDGRVLAGRQRGFSLGITGKQNGLGSQKIAKRCHEHQDVMDRRGTTTR